MSLWAAGQLGMKCEGGGGSRNRVEPALRGNAGEECGVGLGEIIWSD